MTVIGSNPDVTVAGQLYAPSAGSDSRVTGLTLVNGSNTERVNPAIEADRFTIDHCTIDNEHHGIAVHIGATGVTAEDVVIEHNIIRDVGRTPWTNYDHGVYLKNSVRAKIRHNQFLERRRLRAALLERPGDRHRVRVQPRDGRMGRRGHLRRQPLGRISGARA